MQDKLNAEETAMLMEYMLNGYTERTFHILETPFVIRTLTVDQQEDAQKSLEAFKGTQLRWAQTLRLTQLSFGLESFGDQVFENQEQSFEFVQKQQGDALVNKLTEAQSILQSQIKDLLDRAADFSVSPSSSDDSTSSSTETSSLE